MPSTSLAAGTSIVRRPGRDALAFGLIAAAAIAARLPFLLRAHRFFDADEAVEGLMARHLGEHSLFLWGQRYKGTPEVVLSGALFHVAGSSVVALKAVTLACFVVFLCVNFRLVERVLTPRIAWIATAFFIAGPPSLVLWTLSGSAEIVMTLLAGAVLLFAFDIWRTTGSQRALAAAAAALGAGLWIQQYILYYVVALAVTAALRMPGWPESLRAAVRAHVPPWLRAAMIALAAVAAVYVLLGLIAFFTAGVDVRVAGARITATHPQKMWWIAGALLVAASGVGLVAIGRGRLMVPALAFLAGYAPAILGRIGNHGLGSPIARMDANGLRAAMPDLWGVMLPMLLGFRDPAGRVTVFAPLALALVLLVLLSYWSGHQRRLTPFFHMLPLAAAAMFLAGGAYIDVQSYRYLMPIYAALPVVYAVGIDAIWRPSRVAGAVVLAGLVAMFGAQQAVWYGRLTPDADRARALACLDREGVTAARASYWESYPLTFLTRERIIVSPTDGIDRYPPYTERTRDAPSLASVLARCGVSTSSARR